MGELGQAAWGLPAGTDGSRQGQKRSVVGEMLAGKKEVTKLRRDGAGRKDDEKQ